MNKIANRTFYFVLIFIGAPYAFKMVPYLYERAIETQSYFLYALAILMTCQPTAIGFALLFFDYEDVYKRNLDE